jgi:hypothetical protein
VPSHKHPAVEFFSNLLDQKLTQQTCLRSVLDEPTIVQKLLPLLKSGNAILRDNAYKTIKRVEGAQAGEFWTNEVRGRWRWKYSLQSWGTRRTNLFSCRSRVVEMAGPASRKTLPP